MSAHRLSHDFQIAPWRVADPGASGTFDIANKGRVVLQITTLAAETRTIPAPDVVGQKLLAYLDTDGGDCTITINGGQGVTSIVLGDAGDAFELESISVAGTAKWVVAWSSGPSSGANLVVGGTLTVNGASELVGAATLDSTLAVTGRTSLTGNALATGAGAGITDGTGTIYKQSSGKFGGIFETKILIDLTGLASSTTDLDIIGTGTSAAYIAKLTAAEAGTTILTVSMQCLEAPAGGVTDIDLYSATEGTGKFDDAVTGLTETALITSGGAWTNGTTKAATVVPLSTEYIYLTGGAGGTAATYTAGKFLITILGY